MDLAGHMTESGLERVVARAERERLLDRDALLALLERHPGARGRRRLRSILQAGAGPAFTRSNAEDRFLRLVRRGGLPRPAVNVVVEGLEVDVLWRAEGVVVEIDGFAYHGHRGDFERDRRRDAILAAAGFRVVRVTWRQLLEESEGVLVRLAGRAAFA